MEDPDVLDISMDGQLSNSVIMNCIQRQNVQISFIKAGVGFILKNCPNYWQML